MTRPLAPAMREKKTRHLASMIHSDGEVAALCFTVPHAIDLRRASWTNRPEAVTCPRCLARLERAGRRT